MKKALVDSNLLVYSINNDSPKQNASRRFLKKDITNYEFVVAHQNIFESVRVLTNSKFANPMQIDTAIKYVQGIIKPFKIINPLEGTEEIAFDTMKKYSLTSNKVFDAYLIATMLVNDIEIIVTDNDKDFRAVKQLIVINPFSSR